MPASCIVLTRSLNSCTCSPRLPLRVLVVRREVADRVVAPVVDQPAIAKARILDELMHGQKLDGRHAEALQILDRLGVRHAGIGAAQLVGDERVRLGEALDVRLVDDGLVPRRLRPAVLSPVEERVDRRCSSARTARCRDRSARIPAPRSDTERQPRSSSTGRRSPSRRDRAAAWRDWPTSRCSGAQGPCTRKP